MPVWRWGRYAAGASGQGDAATLQSKSEVRISLAPAGEDLQQDHRIARESSSPQAVMGCAVAAGHGHLLGAGQSDQRQCGGNLSDGIIVDVVGVVKTAFVRDPADVADWRYVLRLDAARDRRQERCKSRWSWPRRSPINRPPPTGRR